MLASEFLQNIVFINLQLSDQEKIERFIALSNLYNQVKQAVWYILYGIHIFFFHLQFFVNVFYRVSDPDPDPDPQDPHVFALPGSGSGQQGKEMNE